jgi:hypothetical protein
MLLLCIIANNLSLLTLSKDFTQSNVKWVSKLNPLLFSISNLMLKNGSTPDLPVQNPFWHSKRNFSVCAFYFSFKISHITCLKYANPSTVFHLLFVIFLVRRYDNIVFHSSVISSIIKLLKNQQSLVKLVSCTFIKFRLQVIFARWSSIFLFLVLI